MRSSKSRSRNKNRNNRHSGGSVINRVFDSSGPDGKVRGTPQQIIEKYNQLHRDAQLSGDRVNAENFAQHAEHYTRLQAEAQREVDSKREEQEAQNRERQAERDRERAERQEREAQQPQSQPRHETEQDPGSAEQPAADAPQESTLVDTPESKPKTRRAPRRKPKPKTDAGEAPKDSGSGDQVDAAE